MVTVSVQSPRPTGHGPSARPSPYDLLLLVVPLPTLLGFAVGSPLGEYGGALASLATVLGALFLAPPTGPSG